MLAGSRRTSRAPRPHRCAAAPVEADHPAVLATHCAMSLSGDRITTRSTAGSAAKRAAAAHRVVGLELDHRPHHDAQGAQGILGQGELGEQSGGMPASVL